MLVRIHSSFFFSIHLRFSILCWRSLGAIFNSFDRAVADRNFPMKDVFSGAVVSVFDYFNSGATGTSVNCLLTKSKGLLVFSIKSISLHASS